MAHNGGRSQVNFWTLEFNGCFPFINRLKAAYGWDTNAEFVDVDVLDSNGYPLSLPSGTYHGQCDIEPATEYSGNWILDWVGNGTIEVNSDVTTVSGSLTGTDGQYVFTNNVTSVGSGNNFLIGISATNAGNPISRIRVYRADQATNIANGEVWCPRFVQKLRTANFGVLRFMDWTQTNVSNVVTWARRRSQDYITYGGSQWFSDLWAGDSTNVGNAYTVAAPSSFTSLVDKAQVTFRVNADGSGLSGYTLKVGTSAAKRMTYPGGSGTGGGPEPNDFFTSGPAATTMCTATYDADIDQWLLTGGRVNENRGIINGIPPELAVSLCNLVGAHPWFCFPAYSLDPASDYVTSLATYCRDNLASGLKPRFECVNEVWNTFGFAMTDYARNKSDALWGTGAGDQDNWYGKVASTAGQDVSAVYGADRSRYEMIFGVHTALNTIPTDRLAATEYVTQDAGDPASDWVTQIAITNYWFSTDTDADFVTAGDDYDAAVGDAAKLAVATSFAATSYGTTGPNASNGIPYLLTQFSTWQTIANANSLGLTCYEGGYGLDFGNATTGQRNLVRAVHNVAGMYNQYSDVYNGFVSGGGVFPSQYVMAGTSGLSILSPDINDASSPAFDFIEDFNNGQPAPIKNPHGPKTKVHGHFQHPNSWRFN